MRLKIVQTGEPVLRQTGRSLTRAEILGSEIQRLIRDMEETMHDAPGVGLAAPQVGVGLQLAVIEDREEFMAALPPAELVEKERRPVPFHVIINPEIVLRRLPERLRIHGGGSALPHRACQLYGWTSRIAFRRSHGLVRSHSSARDRSFTRQPVH